jgi:AbrB family looped-hinge helix DNA binding protein
MYTVTISPKFQICIPKALRNELHIKAGQKFIIILHANSLQLVPKRDLADVRGIMSGAHRENIRDRNERNEKVSR